MTKKFSAAIFGAVALTTILFFSACSSHSEGASFTSALDEIDAFISHGFVDDAMKSLKKLEKRCFTSYEHLGVFKRYNLLGEKNRAEKILKRAVKKVGKNDEISAVYANFLLRQNRLEEAFVMAENLRETKYSSIYAECVLRKAFVSIENGGDVLAESFGPQKKRKKPDEIIEQKSAQEIREIFCDPKFISVYESAFRGSEESAWIFNAASVLMRRGDYKKAASLYPQKISGYDESLFWGCVFFDAGLYAESLETLLASERLAALDSAEKNESLRAEILALESDGFFIAGEEDESQKIRRELMTLSDGRYVSPLVYMNSAKYSRKKNDAENQFFYLNRLVDEFSDYEPGLAFYGEFALDQMKIPPEDELEKKLRESGLKTLAMEKKDKVPRVYVDDVIGRIDSILDEKKSPDLVVLKDSLATEKIRIEKKQKSVSDIWVMLEQNSDGKNLHPPKIVEYAVLFLISENFYDDAKSLFDGYYKSAHDFAPEDHPENLEIWECEVAAWLYCREGNFQKGIALYSFIAEKFGDRMAVLNSSSKNSAVMNSFVNLGVLFASIDRYDEALEMLNKASAKATDKKEKAEILYRMAELSRSSGDLREASRTLKYALSLDSSNNKARLLQKKISAEEKEKE